MDSDKDIIDHFISQVTSLLVEIKDLNLGQFSRRISNLEHNIQAFSGQTIRSGLIGITSSGKSSLLNTLLGTGEKILKEQSKATTNMITFCAKSKTPELNIFFEDAPPPA